VRISIHRALLLLVGGIVVALVVPAAILVDRRLAAELEQKARRELSMAPAMLADRNVSRADALMMRAKDLSRTAPLLDAVKAGDREAAIRAALDAATERLGVVVVSAANEVWTGPPPPGDFVATTRGGDIPVGFVSAPEGPVAMALAPLVDSTEWLGAAGVVEPVDEVGAAALAGFTRADVIVVAESATVAATTLDPAIAAYLAAALPPGAPGHSEVREVGGPRGNRYWIVAAPLERAGRILFVRDVARELAILPRLRNGALVAASGALLLALVVGALAAGAIARPVRSLSHVAERLAEGDFRAPLTESAIEEVAAVSQTFAVMRNNLERRLTELEEANQLLADQQAHLQALQSELIQRDRLAESGRLVAELAHEIRNPVASLRNCLEVLDRRVAEEPEAREFTRLAIEELLRMHRLAEQLLDLNRPLDIEATSCDANVVMRQVAALMQVGSQAERWPIEVDLEESGRSAIGPDALKQVIINLVQNAQEAMPEGGPIELRSAASDGWIRLEVTDRGPGIPDDVLPRVFDAFFTTKGEVSGAGFGLFVAEGIVRRHGGRIRAANRTDGAGARFVIEVPRSEDYGDGPAEAESGRAGEQA